jgi:hypothetical protein
MAESGGPGVQIVRVTPSSAAAQAGLRVGDVVLQVNGRGASSPQRAAEMIRQIPIGKSGTLTIWRDGDQRQLQVTMQAAPARSREMDQPMMGREIIRDSYQVGFRGDDEPASGGSSARILRLEQQIGSLTQDLAAMRQELAQLRSAGSVQTTGYNAELNQGSTPSAPPASAPTNSLAPPPGFGQTEEKASKSATEATKVATPPAPAAAPAKPAAPAPAAEKPAGNDLFGTDSAPPKSSEKPKTEDKKPANDSKGGSDDLFK